LNCRHFQARGNPNAACHRQKYPGRSERQKTELTMAIVKDVMAITQVGDDAVFVAIEEVAPGDWDDRVYKPDILNSAGKLYKKPGYNPLE
jgi:4-oxalocrotonate tautomerase